MTTGRTGASDEVTGGPTGAHPAWLVAALVAGIGLAALNLRTAITSIGPVLDEITSDLAMSGATAGMLTTLPVLCFAAFGALTPLLIRRFGEHHVLVVALAALTLGLGTRVLAGQPWLFLALSTVALSGGAVGNVLLPTLVKQHFPHRVGAMTTLYTTAMAAGTALAAAMTVPLAEATGGRWRVALGCYAVLGLLAIVPWLLTLRREPGRAPEGRAISVGQVLRTAMGWQSVVFFGTQSIVAYVMFGWFAQLLRDSGLDATTAGLALSYLTALGVPVSLTLPGLAARVRDHRIFVVCFFLAYIAGFTGLWVAPVAGVWAWATLIGMAMSTFPFALTLFALRTRTADGTAALSAASQSIGYLMAGLGPFLFGLLREVSGSWDVPLAMVMGIVALNFTAGMFLGRPRYLEDTLEAAAARK
ncbi:CynX/NimT family MFS transporter [Salinactinospora qingdaonensis]|uniref:MFS transporter n=1 Tax=Salinactinospora qingdaonensis TaxID=702744 RepID=A0ABP7FID2_9ACTN